MLKNSSRTLIIWFIFSGIDPRNNKEGLDIQAFGPDDVVITDGNGTIISNPTKRESTDDATTLEPETTTTSVTEAAKKERKRREAEGKNENGEDKSSIEPVSFCFSS